MVKALFKLAICPCLPWLLDWLHMFSLLLVSIKTPIFAVPELKQCHVMNLCVCMCFSVQRFFVFFCPTYAGGLKNMDLMGFDLMVWHLCCIIIMGLVRRTHELNLETLRQMEPQYKEGKEVKLLFQVKKLLFAIHCISFNLKAMIFIVGLMNDRSRLGQHLKS